ncbi:MAG: FliM/FliN family flagellar motor C-terminal domain-containing protein [Telluria sp.]
MPVTPYRLLKRSACAALAERAAAALARWSADWAALPDHTLACVDATRAPAGFAAGAAVQAHRLAGGGQAWSAQPAGAPRWLEQQLFGLEELDAAAGRHRASALGAGVAEEALADLHTALLAALTGQQPDGPGDAGAPPAAAWRRGAGLVLCTVRFGARSLQWLAPVPAAAPPAPTRRPPLQPLRAALAARTVRLHVELGEAEVTLGDLRGLRIGDVLALPAPLGAPLRVANAAGVTLCHGHLGAAGGQRAVELTIQKN